MLKHPCINIYIILGKSLWRLLMCSCTLDFLFVMYVQYGHFKWGFFPHSSLKCLLRFAFHVYSLWHLGHGKWELMFAVGVLWEHAVIVRWLLINQFCVVYPRSGVTGCVVPRLPSSAKKNSCPQTVAPSAGRVTNIVWLHSHGPIILSE